MGFVVSIGRFHRTAALAAALLAAGCGKETKIVDRCAGVVCASPDACHLAGVCDGNTGTCTDPPKGIVPTVGPLSFTAPQAGVVYAGDLVQFDQPSVTLGCGPVAAGDVSYRWTFLRAPAGSSAVLTSSTVAAPAFVPDLAGGLYQVALTVTDRLGNAAPPVFLDVLVSTCGGSAPVASIAPVAPADFRVGAVLAGSASDADLACPARFHGPAGYPLFTWSTLASPIGARTSFSTPNAAAAQLQASGPGQYLVELVATDWTGRTGTATALVSLIDCVVSAPTLAICSNPVQGCTGSPVQQSVGGAPKAVPDARDVVVLTVPGALITDANNSPTCPVTPFSFRWTLLSSPAGSRAQLSSSTAAAPILVPDVIGTYQVAVSAVDAFGAESAIAIHQLTTSNCGANPPSVSVAGAPASPLEAWAFATLSATVNDPDDLQCPAQFHNPPGGMTVAWSVVGSPLGGAATLTSTASASTGFSAAIAGVYTVRATATDSTGRTGHADVNVAVSTCGSSAPVITSVVSPVSRPSLSSAVSLTANAYDADQVLGGTCGGTPKTTSLEYRWRLVSAPFGSTATVTPTFSTSPTVTFVPDLAGTFAFEVTALDAAGLLSAPMTVSVPTGSCGPTVPQPTTPFGVITVGSIVNVQLPSPITDRCISQPLITLAWSFLSRPAGSGAALASPSQGLFVPDVPGIYVVQALATDQAGFSTAVSTSLLVGACTASPGVAIQAAYVAPPGGDTGGTPPLAGDLVELSALVTPAACGAVSGAPFTFAWTLLSRPAGSTAVLGPAGSDRPSFVADVPGGSYQVAATVTDSLGNQGTAYQTIAVSPCGSQASVAAIANGATATIATKGLLSLGGSASVVNVGCPARLTVSPASFAWQLVWVPIGGTALWTGQSGPSVTFSPQLPSNGTPYRVSLTATGSNGVVGPPAFIDVTASP